MLVPNGSLCPLQEVADLAVEECREELGSELPRVGAGVRGGFGGRGDLEASKHARDTEDGIGQFAQLEGQLESAGGLTGPLAVRCHVEAAVRSRGDVYVEVDVLHGTLPGRLRGR